MENPVTDHSDLIDRRLAEAQREERSEHAHQLIEDSERDARLAAMLESITREQSARTRP